MKYIVKAGKLELGRTDDYNQAVEWMRTFDRTSVSGPYARIIEKEE